MNEVKLNETLKDNKIFNLNKWSFFEYIDGCLYQ